MFLLLRALSTCMCMYICTVRQTHAHTHTHTHAYWSIFSHYLWKHTNIYLHRYSQWENNYWKFLFLFVSLYFSCLNWVIKIFSWCWMSCCMFTTMFQSDSVCTYCIGYSKVMAGKCKHSDSKFTGSFETTRKLQKNLILISFQGSTIF